MNVAERRTQTIRCVRGRLSSVSWVLGNDISWYWSKWSEAMDNHLGQTVGQLTGDDLLITDGLNRPRWPLDGQRGQNKWTNCQLARGFNSPGLRRSRRPTGCRPRRWSCRQAPGPSGQLPGSPAAPAGYLHQKSLYHLLTRYTAVLTHYTSCSHVTLQCFYTKLPPYILHHLLKR